MPVHAALLGVDLTAGRWVMRSLCPSMASARSASLLPPGPTPRAWAWPGPGLDFFFLSTVDLVSWLCRGPGLEPKGGRDRAVPNFKLGCGAVTVFSKLKISVDGLAA